MKHTTQYSVGGEIYDVSDDRYDEFIDDAAWDYEEEEPEEVYTFWVNGEEVQVKASRLQEFLADCEADGVSPQKTQQFEMDDGAVLRLGDEDVRQFVQARRQGMPMSRGLLKNTGIPEQYGRSATEREALADMFGAYYPDEQVAPQYLKREENVGDVIKEGYDRAQEWMDEGSQSGEFLPMAAKGLQGTAGRIVKGFADTGRNVANAVGAEGVAGMIGAVGDALPTELPDYGNEYLNKAAEITADTGAGVIKYGVLGNVGHGAIAADIGAGSVETFKNTYAEAIANGADEDRAVALAAAAAGISAAEGYALSKSIGGAKAGFVKNALETSGKMAVAGAAGDVVQQGVEGAENPDLGRAAIAGLKSGGEGLAYSAMSGVAHGVAGRRAAQEAARARQEREEEAAREIDREEAKTRYEANLSEEAQADVDAMVGEMIKNEVIPSWRHAEEVKQRAIEKLGGREAGESHEAVEQAVMEAAQEVQERLNTTERVETPSHERRTVEARMRDNEYWAKRSDELAEEYGKEEAARKLAEEQEAVERKNAADKAESEEHKDQQEDIEAAFDEVGNQTMKPDGKGKMVKVGGADETAPAEPEAEVETQEAVEEEYAKVPDGKGKRRLTGIAAQRKAAADEEQKLKTTFIENEHPHGMLDYLAENGNLFGKPAKKKIKDARTGKTRFVYDDQTAGNALDNFFDGMTDAEKKRWERRIFGGIKNNNGSQRAGDTGLEAMREYFGNPDMTIDDALDMLRKEYDEYEAFKKNGGKTSEQVHDEYEAEQARAREVKIDGDYYDIEDIEGNKKSDETYNNAMAEVEKFGDESPEIQNFGQERLNEIKKGDTIRFDHSEMEWSADRDFDGKTGEIVVSAKDIDDNPLFTEAEKAEMRGRRFRITENGWIELKENENGNQQENGKGADEAFARDAQGEQGKEAESFELESKSAEEIAAEERERKKPANETQAPTIDAKAAAKLLGTDAYLPKEDLQKKIDQWSQHADDPRMAQKIEAARAMLADRAAKEENANTENGGATTDGKSAVAEKTGDVFSGLTLNDKQKKSLDLLIKPIHAKASPIVDASKVREVSVSDSGTLQFIKLTDSGFDTVYVYDDGRIEGSHYTKDGRRIRPSGNPENKSSFQDMIDDGFISQDFVDSINGLNEAKQVPDGKGRMVEKAKSEKNGTQPERKVVEQDGGYKIVENIDDGGYEIVSPNGHISRNVKGINTIEEARENLQKQKHSDEIRESAPKATLSNGEKVFLQKTKDGWVACNLETGMRADGGVFAPGKSQEDAISKAEKYIANTNVQQEAPKASSTPTDAGFDAWAVGRDGKPIEFASENERKTSREMFDNLVKQGRVDGETGKLLEAEDADNSVAMRSNDPKRRSEESVVAWAKKNGRQVINGMVTPDARREYDAQMAQKAAKSVKRLFPDMKVDYYDKAPELGGEGKRIEERSEDAIEMRNKHGDVLGWFSPSTKQVALLPGADAETVAHEIGWHGVRDWAKRNSTQLFNKMREVEDNVDPELRNKVLRIYRKASGYNRDDLLNEFGAWTFMGKGGEELQKVISSKEGAAWYAKMLNAAKDLYKDYATKHGGNRVDLSEIDSMDGETFMNHMASEIAAGKTLGNIGAPTGTGKEISTKESLTDAAKRKVYDVGATFRTLEKEIGEKTGQKVASDDSVDQALALRPGMKEASNIRHEAEIKKLQGLYKKNGVSHEDFSYYMACKAAQGRDAKVDARNIEELKKQAERDLRAEWGEDKIRRDPNGWESALDAAKADAEAYYRSSNGSNINPREAAKTIREWESGDMAAKTEEMRKEWRKLIDATIDRQVEAGLVSKEQADEWKRQEPDYVPFKSPVDEASGEYVGRSTDLSKPEHYAAKGRKTSAGDVLTHALLDSQATENRAIENEVRQKLAKLVEANPELGTVTKLGNRKIGEQKTNEGVGEKDVAKNVLVFKRDGESYVIELNGTRGEAMAAAITGRNKSNFGNTTLLKFGDKKLTVRDVSRVWSSFATEWSPTFAIRNTIKDNAELANIVASEMGPVKGAKFAAHYAKGQATNAKDVWNYARNGEVAAGSELESFINDGGMIGGYKNEGYGETAEKFTSKSIDQMMKKGDRKSNAIKRYTTDLVGSVAKMSELQTRVNAYAAAKKMGMSGKEAALWSRRAVTDFNRAGEMTGTTNVLRMFSNSTLGATARGISALTANKYGAATAASLVGMGYLEAMLEEEMNADSDEKAKKTGEASTKSVSEYERQNSFMIRSGDKEYRLPIHESPFSMLKYFGNCVRRVQSGNMTKEQMAKELGLSVATLASHLSGWGDVNFDSEEGGASGTGKAFASSSVPSVLQPVVEILGNTDYAGREVYRKEFPSETTPRSERGKKNTPETYKNVAKYLNEATGGNEARRGWLDVHPETLQKLVEGGGKNMSKDAVTAYMTLASMFNGDFSDLATKNTIVKRDFVRDVGDSSNEYYKYKKENEADVAEWDKRKGKMTSQERKDYLEKHPNIVKREALNKLVNGYTTESGERVYGIDDLRKLANGYVRTAKNKWIKREEPKTEEEKANVAKYIEKWQAELRRKQAAYIRMFSGK